MQILNFQDENDGSVTKAAILEDVEKVSPIRFYAQTQIETKKDLIKTIMVIAVLNLKIYLMNFGIFKLLK